MSLPSKTTPSPFLLPQCEYPALPSSRHRQDKTWGGMEQPGSQAQGETATSIQGTEGTAEVGQLFRCRSIACNGDSGKGGATASLSESPGLALRIAMAP